MLRYGLNLATHGELYSSLHNSGWHVTLFCITRGENQAQLNLVKSLLGTYNGQCSIRITENRSRRNKMNSNVTAVHWKQEGQVRMCTLMTAGQVFTLRCSKSLVVNIRNNIVTSIMYIILIFCKCIYLCFHLANTVTLLNFISANIFGAFLKQ